MTEISIDYLKYISDVASVLDAIPAKAGLTVSRVEFYSDDDFSNQNFRLKYSADYGALVLEVDA